MPELTLTEAYRVRSSEADAYGDLSLPSLCLYLQEVAWNHARTIDWGLSPEQTWMLARVAIRIEALPCWDDEVRVRTWARGIERSFAMRDFAVETADGRLLAAASSAWLVIDMSTRRPVRHHVFPDHVPVMPDRLALGRSPQKLPKLESPDLSEPIEVRYGDLDVNGHVNYARYVGWIMDRYGSEFRRAHVPQSLEIDYLAETLEGDLVRVAGMTDGNGALHAVIRGSDTKEACRARVSWRRLSEPRRTGERLLHLMHGEKR